MEPQNNNNYKEEKNDLDIRDQIAIILLSIFLVTLWVFFIFLFIRIIDRSNSDSNIPPISVEEKEYKDFYDHMIDVSNDYMDTYFSKSNYTEVVNAVTYKDNALSYMCLTPLKNEGALFNISLTNSSLEEVISSFNASELDLSTKSIEVTLYRKDTNKSNINTYEFYGIDEIDDASKCYTSTYEENNEYVSAINSLNASYEIVKENKTKANTSNPLAYSLLKYIYSFS